MLRRYHSTPSPLFPPFRLLPEVALQFLTSFFKTYLASSNLDSLSILLRKSGISDLLLVFPSTIRDRAHLEKHFKGEGLDGVWEWYLKKAAEKQQVEVVARLKEILESGDDNAVEEVRCWESR